MEQQRVLTQDELEKAVSICKQYFNDDKVQEILNSNSSYIETLESLYNNAIHNNFVNSVVQSNFNEVLASEIMTIDIGDYENTGMACEITFYINEDNTVTYDKGVTIHIKGVEYPYRNILLSI